jgi:hypothetical protein
MNKIHNNWRLFLESHTKEQEEELKDIVGELENASKMHATQAKRIQQLLDETDDDKLEEGEGKNCGCGQDPCKTYGVQVKIGEDELEEKKKPGLWANIKAKKDRIKAGSGEKKAKPGDKDYPETLDIDEHISAIIDEEIEAVFNDLDEKKKKKKKKPCKKAKGKRYVKRVNGRCRSYGQSGKAKDGGDRIRPGTKKGDAYCARSAKIKKCKNPPCANALSRKKWKCRGSKSMKE